MRKPEDCEFRCIWMCAATGESGSTRIKKLSNLCKAEEWQP
jgi:hypothetical protein